METNRICIIRMLSLSAHLSALTHTIKSLDETIIVYSELIISRWLLQNEKGSKKKKGTMQISVQLTVSFLKSAVSVTIILGVLVIEEWLSSNGSTCLLMMRWSLRRDRYLGWSVLCT